MRDTQPTAVSLGQPDGAARPVCLPSAFMTWQLNTRRAMYDTIRAGRHPRRHPAHLPVMITFEADGNIPIRVATKGAGITPRDEVLERYIDILEEALDRCEERPWVDTLVDRVAAVQPLLDRPEDIDPCRLGFLEIFKGGTYRNLLRDPRVALHYTGEGPDYPSFQINGQIEILNEDDLRYRYIALARRIFEAAPFHLPQPAYAAGYLVWVQDVFDKTPYSLHSKSRRTHARAIGERRPRVEPDETPVTTSLPSCPRCPTADPVAPRSAARGVTFREIMVPVDNSTHSRWAMDIALQIAGGCNSRVVGSHVYAARLHDQRFRDMEPGLPDEYQQPDIMLHQRNLHDTLIERGLKLISDSYLETLKLRCERAGLRFESKTPEGKNYAELVRDAETSAYDLIVIGARGQGWQGLRTGHDDDNSDAQALAAAVLLGSVCERVVRHVSRDVLVVKDHRPLEGEFVVGIDGSDRSYGALRIALALADVTGARVQAVAVYDPYLHASLFHELEETLTEEARRVFNSDQQQKLHDELIDDGIAKIYGDHLETARRIAEEAGQELETFLLAGKPFAAVAQHLRDVQPTLLVLGRTGVHADEGLDVGSNADNLLRLSRCHVLLTGRTFRPTRAQARQVVTEGLAWTPEALERLDRVPDFARGMARQAIEDFARERDMGVVDEALVVEARQRLGMGG